MVPWKDISSDVTEYIDSDCLPDDVDVKEPSKLKLTEVGELWEHWRSRQKKGVMGLEFIKAKGGDMRENNRKGKKRAQKPWTDPELSSDELGNNPDLGSSRSQQQHQASGEASGSGRGQSSAQQDGPHDDPHPQSPAANKATKKQRMAFLNMLSSNVHYLDMLKRIFRLKVSPEITYIVRWLLIVNREVIFSMQPTCTLSGYHGI